jgi:acyl-CoA synthetase (AMP-forming)/AMP-acid ligase II
VTPSTPAAAFAQLRPLGSDLAAYGDQVAIVTADGEISYAALAARVEAAARQLGAGRRLVLIAGANTVDAVVAYLAALGAGHPVLLAPGDNPAALEALTAAYDPDVVVRAVDGRWCYQQRRAGSAHVLHQELALLLSTSGSTGSPKLVRLSYENLRANAESIATYLGIRGTDRAATTLPIHYCYGLSVVNSHLVRGAGLILTGLSVADTCFWDLFERARGTSFAGVPYTFTLLDRIGFASMRLPHLRYVTQAGGRLAPEKVTYYANLGRRHGWDLFVMYGQTEATARMAYLPPERAATHPAAIGVPVPGGSLRLEPLEDSIDPDAGELVFTGPNVMLGYAESSADLCLGRTVRELRTGDIARRNADGLYEILGRRSRFVKVFGLRIDLDRVESGLEADGVTACCVGRDDELVVVVEAAGDRENLDRLVAARCALPVRAVRVTVVPELPRLASGKPDHRAVGDLAGSVGTAEPTPARPAAGDSSIEIDLCALYAEILDRPDVTEQSSFVDLGGDSLSYVEMSVRLEEALGHLPAGWHTMAIRDLAATQPPREAKRARVRRGRWLDTSVALRATSIVLIVGTHIGLFTVRGGAHLLLAVAGFNFARFHLTTAARRDRVRHIAATVTRVAVPSAAFIALMVLLTGKYSWANVFLLNEAIGPRTGPHRDFWFVETFVYIMLALVIVLAVPVLDRWERRLPFAFPAVLLALALTVRYDVIELSPWDNLTTPAALFWFFALGWAGGKASTTKQRLLVTAVVTGTILGYFTSPLRAAVVVTGVLLLIWLPRVPGMVCTNRLAGALAGGSLAIYLTHWQVYPLLDDRSRLLALLGSLAVGVLYATIVDRTMNRLAGLPRLLRPAARLIRTPRRSSVAPVRRALTGRHRMPDRNRSAQRAVPSQ